MLIMENKTCIQMYKVSLTLNQLHTHTFLGTTAHPPESDPRAGAPRGNKQSLSISID